MNNFLILLSWLHVSAHIWVHYQTITRNEDKSGSYCTLTYSTYIQ